MDTTPVGQGFGGYRNREPQKATPEKGKKFTDAVTTKIADFLVELAECNTDELYN